MCLILPNGHFHCDQFWQHTLRLQHKSECHLIYAPFALNQATMQHMGIGICRRRYCDYSITKFPFKMYAKLLADKVFTDQLCKEQRNVTSKATRSPPLFLLHDLQNTINVCVSRCRKRGPQQKGVGLDWQIFCIQNVVCRSTTECRVLLKVRERIFSMAHQNCRFFRVLVSILPRPQ